MAFLPYLNFGGNCRDAFTRYHEIFGGELFIQKMSEMPGAPDMPPEQGELVLHAALMLPDGSMLMASDAENPAEFGRVQGMWVNHSVKDVEEGRRVFDALSEGGSVEMEFGETFWSPGYGMCTDRFGTPWMVNVESAQGLT